jgi:hypothetical protein
MFSADLSKLAVAQPPEAWTDVETEPLLESAQEHFEDCFAKLRKKADASRLSAKFEVAAGHPAEQILYHADSLGAGHIVPGHAAKTPFSAAHRIGIQAHRLLCRVRSVTVVR